MKSYFRWFIFPICELIMMTSRQVYWPPVTAPRLYLGRRCWESLCVIVTALIMFWLDNTKLCRLKTHGTRYTHFSLRGEAKTNYSIWKMFEKFFGHFECVAHDAEVSPCWGAELCRAKPLKGSLTTEAASYLEPEILKISSKCWKS